MHGRARSYDVAARVLKDAAMLVLIGAIGCAGTSGVTLSDVERIRAELPALEARASERPEDPRAQAAYGLALRALDEGVPAVTPLERAFELDPREISAALALGSLYERAGREEAAGEVYDRAEPRSRADRRMIAAARAALERRRLTRQMQALAANEAQVDVARIPESTMAVTGFEAGSGARDLEGLGKALSVVVATELANLPGVALVERQKLEVLLDELAQAHTEEKGSSPLDLAPASETRGIQQRLATLVIPGTTSPYYSGPIDGQSGRALRQSVQDFQRDHGLTADGIVGPRTVAALDAAMSARKEATPPATESAGGPLPRAGRLLGARRLLGGRYFALQSELLSVEARVEDTVTGEMVAEVESRRPRDSFHEITGDLVIKTADALSLPLTPEDRRRIMSLPPVTRSLAAFLAFGQAVDLEDQGLLDQAAEAYGQAVRLDPGFALAREKSEVLRVGSAAFQQSIDRTLRAALGRLGASGRARMASALSMVGTGVEEDAPRDDQADGMNRTAQAEGAPTGQARVRGQIPVGGRP